MRSTLLAVAVGVLALGASAEAFVHPGLQSTKAELDKIKATVNGTAAHPMKDGWNKMRASSLASLDYQPSPYAIVHVVGSGGNAEESAIRNDAIAAYAHALQWVVTGNSQNAQKAIQIIDAWSAVFQDIVPADGSPAVQDSLESDWYAPMWLNAAEILRRYGSSGWSSANITRFNNTMVSVFKTRATEWSGSAGCCPNQGISAAFARAAIGVYLDDQATYDSGIGLFKNTMLARMVGSDGEILELNRAAGGDCGHAAYNIEGAFDLAEIAYHQGTDLYQIKLSGDKTPRLVKGVEYMAKCITTGMQTTSEGFVQCSTQKPVGFEVAYNHYINRLSGYSLPNTSALLGQQRPVDQGSGKFIPWDTLTHAQLSAGAAATPTATRTSTATATRTATATARARVTATAARATSTARARATATSSGKCAGVAVFKTCTAYANGAKVTFNNSLYHAIADIPSTRDCPPNSPYDPGNDNWWVNDGGC